MTKRNIDWEAVARDYHASDCPVAEIARKHGLAAITIYAKAKRDGWARPGPIPGAATAKTHKPRKHGFTKRVRKNPTRMPTPADDRIDSGRALGRMMIIINRLADELERHLDSQAEGQNSAADKKSAADILTSLARALEKLTVLEREAASAMGKIRSDDHLNTDNIAGADDDWDEVQRRLARLAAAEPAQ